MRLIITSLFILVIVNVFAQKAKVYNSNLVIVNSLIDYNKSLLEDSDFELIDLEEFIPGIVLDIRYADTNNFTSKKVYLHEKAFARKPVAEKLKLINTELNKKNWALKIYDAYRPYSATVLFYEIYKDTTFVASPWTGSRHNRGAAVDVSIVNLATGKEIQMPTQYDDFTEIAKPSYHNLDENVIHNRDYLISLMETYGFKVYHSEWWHFDFNGWERFPLMDISFEELEKNNKETIHNN